MESITDYYGAQLGHVYRGPVTTATCAVDRDGKLEYNGPLCVDHIHSLKYHEEAHIIIFQREEPRYVLRKAKSRNWHRVEFHTTVEEMDDLCTAWLVHRGRTVT